MRLLLDTHVLLWALGNPERLDTAARAAIVSPENDVFVSAASAWEIAIKHALGRLEFPVKDLETALHATGFQPLPIMVAHALAAGALPRHHDDPFDRLLVAQAKLEGLTLLSVDRQLARYDVALFRSQA